MKPRVLIVGKRQFGSSYRIVRRGGNWSSEFVVEKADGLDALNRQRWQRVGVDALKEECCALLEAVGAALVKREKAARKARRARGGR